MTGRPVKRSYDSPARRAQATATRDRILQAAETLFVRDGFARTSIRAIAADAGVSEATVYVTFASKAALLNQAIIRAVAESGSESAAEIVTADAEHVLRRLARSHTATLRRAGRVIAIGESAATMDADLRPLRDRAHEDIQAGLRRIADRLHDAGLLRTGLGAEAAANILYGLSNETTYLRLTEGAGFSPERYEEWLAQTLSALLLRASG